MAADRGRADTDVRHQFVIGMICQPDYHAGGQRCDSPYHQRLFYSGSRDYFK